MRLNKKAYIPLLSSEYLDSIGEIQLYNNYILSLSIDENSFASQLNLSHITQRVTYNIEFLDRYSRDLPSAQNFAKISYNDTAGLEKSIYIKINIIERFHLKWIFKKTFIQKHYQFWLPTLISFLAVAFTIFGWVSNNSIENKLTKIDSLDSTVKYNQGEIILLQQDFSGIKSLINDSILLKKDTINLKN